MKRSKKRKLAANAARVAEVARSKTGRTCGECHACCVRLAITSLEKPDHNPCRYLAPRGCGIYEERPQECRAFLCGWLLGWGDEDARPDRSGVLISVPGRTPKLRLFRLLSVRGVSIVDLPIVKTLKDQIRRRLFEREPGLPVGFMVDSGRSDAQIEIPRGSEPYFAHELRQAGAREKTDGPA